MSDQVIQMNKYGRFLQGREEGRTAFAKLEELIDRSDAAVQFLFNFDEVLVFAPSYCDEVFGPLNEKYPGRIYIQEDSAHSIKVAFETVEETRGSKFSYK